MLPTPDNSSAYDTEYLNDWPPLQFRCIVNKMCPSSPMSLDTVVTAILGENGPQSLYDRAIRLYEFQIAIFHRTSFARLLKAEDDTRAATKRLKTARIFVALKFFEKIERDLKQERSVNFMTYRDLAGHEQYCRLFDDVFAKNGGWSRIRHSEDASTFDEDIDARCAEARVVANVVDFSYRFSIYCKERKLSGGVDNARYVLEKAPEYKSSIGESQIKNRWREYKQSSIFLYLLLVQNFDLRPPRISSTNFLAKLLKQADNTAELRRFFAAYQAVYTALLSRRYKDLPAIALHLDVSDIALNVSDFPSTTYTIIDSMLR